MFVLKHKIIYKILDVLSLRSYVKTFLLKTHELRKFVFTLNWSTM